jgi:cytochrome c oxidase assembly protein subunit 17
MSSVTDTKAANDDSAAQPEKKCKPCCACPETKKARDQCIVENGEENCKELIQAHKECMKKMGFDV